MPSLYRVCVLCLSSVFWLTVSANAEEDPELIRSTLPGKKTKPTQNIVPNPAPELVPAELGLRVGERLFYDIRVGGISVGNSFIEVQKTENHGQDNGPMVWKVAMKTRSSRGFSLWHGIKDDAKSSIDVKAGFSRRFHIKKGEGDVRDEEEISFIYDIDNTHAVSNRLRFDGQWRTKQVPLSGKHLDPLAALYYLRAIDFTILHDNNSIYLPICQDRRHWDLQIKVVGTSWEDFGEYKNRECWMVVLPDPGFSGLFERKGTMKIWIDKLSRIPVKMTVEVPIGAAEVLLTEHSNSPLDK